MRTFPYVSTDTLLCASEAGFYFPFWSQDILDGATRNLVATGRMSLENSKRLETKIKTAFPDAIVAVTDELIEVMTNHPGDRHVLATAVVAKANIIVTSNLKHFQNQDLAPWSIQAQSPDEFLTNLYNSDSDKMVKVVQRQSQSLKKPPMNFNALLDLLAREVPGFVSNVLSYKSETL
ncbi:PIN domain-containing protein [Nostoc sp. CMAA1605]|uniref:PIN domain-containing protein n=1 Tax=Nostoc sp. CMAA1605 TaxID=2055159 RepID=UPI001F3580E1|nr:PIN domain-containing protein [Nostoc sp. CMAA1605]MCF4970418.1 PIN domain-containing protein [Nostoc sp. CMAA1605]